MALTNYERNLIKHPPTTGTWLCRATRITSGGEKTTCNTPNSAKARECWLCTRPKPRKPKLIWPLYVEACRKAGIAPKGGAT